MEIKQVNSLLDVIGEKISIYKKIKSELNKNHALDFNPIEIFFSIGENKLSQIITFFLNPDERHFQGSLYLEPFLQYLRKEFEIDIPAFKEIISIRTEYPIDNRRRIDVCIVYKTENSDHCIAIENKIWAIDQENQLNDYNLFLKNKFPDKYHLLYLNPHGTNPSKESITPEELKDNSRIKILNHSKGTLNLIDQWISVTRPQPIRDFLNHTKNYLEKEINNLKFMDMEEAIIEAITTEKLEAAFAINNALQPLKNKVAKEFENQLISTLNEKKDSHNIKSIDPLTYSDIIAIRIVNHDNVIVEMKTSKEEGLLYSLTIPIQEKKVEVYPKAKSKFNGEFNDSAYWDFFGDLRYWYNSAFGVNEMKKKETVEKAANHLFELIEIVNSSVDAK